jgi:hypothetical protein
MSEWWTYSLSDFLLFSPRTYRRLFELFNAELWPLHLAAAAAGVLVAWALRRSGPRLHRAAAIVLGMAWGAVAYAFFMRHYASINWAAPALAGAFALEALLLAVVATAAWTSSARLAGLALIVFGMALQPLIGPLLLGRPWMQVEFFGMAPDPTVTVTLGALSLWPRTRWSLLLWPIPLAWCAVGAATLWTMGDADAWVMPAVAAWAIVARLASPYPLPEGEGTLSGATGADWRS